MTVDGGLRQIVISLSVISREHVFVPQTGPPFYSNTFNSNFLFPSLSILITLKDDDIQNG